MRATRQRLIAGLIAAAELSLYEELSHKTEKMTMKQGVCLKVFVGCITSTR